MSRCENVFAILNELQSNAEKMDQDQILRLEELILSANRIFIGGAGRSGFVGRAFANRMMHLGYTVYFVGEPTTPSIQEGDLLIIGSGSGTTASLVSNAGVAKKQGAKLATVTMFPEHTIGAMSDVVIMIPGVTEKFAGEGGGSVQSSGSSFEELTWITYDAVVMDLMRITKQNDSQLYARHANME